MKHQPAGSGDGCAVYTMRQWVQASGNRPGLAPERETGAAARAADPW